MPTIQATENEQIERFLKARDWKRRGVNPLGEIEYAKGRDEWQVQISKDGWWSIGKFTDSDRPVFGHDSSELLMAVGRFESEAEGNTLAELEQELVSLGVMPWECPYCGEAGGKPITVGWREFQGDSAHGGMVDFTEERCTKCGGKN